MEILIFVHLSSLLGSERSTKYDNFCVMYDRCYDLQALAIVRGKRVSGAQFQCQEQLISMNAMEVGHVNRIRTWSYEQEVNLDLQ